MTRRSPPAFPFSAPGGAVSEVRARSGTSSALGLAAPSRRAAGLHQRLRTGRACFRCHAGSLAFTLACGIPIGAWPAHAWAEELPAEAPARHGESGDLRLSIGGGRAAFWQRDLLIAELDAVSINAALRLGGFVSQHVLLGYEAVGGRHIAVGGLDMAQPRPAREVPARNGYTVIAPLGMFAEFYPIPNVGAFVAASGGVGFMIMPRYGDAGGELLMAYYAVELGYEMSGSGKQGLGGFVRYTRSGADGVVDDASKLTSHDVAAGARWSFF